MLNKMKNDFNYDELKQTAFSNTCRCSENMLTNFQEKFDSLEKFTLTRHQEIEVQNSDLRQRLINLEVQNSDLRLRLIKLEDSFKKQEEKMQTTQLEKGQKLLTEYVTVIVDVDPNKGTIQEKYVKVIDEPIKLNIEEKQVTIPEVKTETTSVPDNEVEIIESPSSNKLDVCDVCNEGLDNEGLGNEGLDNEEHDNESVGSFSTSELALKPDEQTEEAETNVEDEPTKEETNVEDEQTVEETNVEDEQTEEETNVEDEPTKEETNVEEEEPKSEDELQSVETEEKQEDMVEDKEEEEEEVFEIEIDDVTYFATDEENGVIYEMTKNGDIGKKVGVIKDGEPVFNL
jgi:hypothetical protein